MDSVLYSKNDEPLLMEVTIDVDKSIRSSILYLYLLYLYYVVQDANNQYVASLITQEIYECV